MISLWQRFSSLMGNSVDGASLAVFRIGFGAIMVLEAIGMFRPSLSSGGATPLETYYTGPKVTFSFPYPGFEWLPLLSPPLIKGVVWLLAIAGLGMSLGFLYRLSAILVFLTWGYLYALESTRTYWMSHYYLVLLVTFLMIWLPAARRYSLDARRAASTTIPFWPVFLLRGQLVVTYFYAGLAKLNRDWLLDAEPVRYFLSRPHVTTPFQSLNQILHSTEFAYFISYAGALFDLMVGFLLIIRKTRLAGLVLMVFFHGTNHFLFFEDIGWFPLLGVVSALIFLSPDWPESLRTALQSRPRRGPVLTGPRSIPLVPAVCAFVLAWLVWQSLFPLRHYLIPGDARVTFEGLSFSLRLKAEVYRTLACTIQVRDPAVFPPGPQPTIDWTQWNGDRVIYRQFNSEATLWSELPEIVVLHEPIIGERILYNPHANPRATNTMTLAESTARATELWQEIYGREPAATDYCIELSRIVHAFEQVWTKRGGAPGMTPQSLLNIMIQKHGPEGDGQMIPLLRRMHPFQLVGKPPLKGPFLLIHDPVLMPTGTNRVSRTLWRHAPATRHPAEAHYTHVGGDPLVIHTVPYTYETRQLFPTASIFDSHSDPGPPFIAWDHFEDVTVSKAVHLSMQPFLLRRYARRVADLWETKHGRRPAVRAATHVSLNGRPFQPAVDPAVDLANARFSPFHHNEWIRDLEQTRIPPDNVLPDFLGNVRSQIESQGPDPFVTR